MSSAVRCFASASQTPQLMYGVMSSGFMCVEDMLRVGCMRIVMRRRGKSAEEYWSDDAAILFLTSTERNDDDQKMYV